MRTTVDCSFETQAILRIIFTNRSNYFGVTPPISTSVPTTREEEITATLEEELRRQGVFESEEESLLR